MIVFSFDHDRIIVDRELQGPGSESMLLQTIFKIRIFNLAENECQTTKFPGF